MTTTKPQERLNQAQEELGQALKGGDYGRAAGLREEVAYLKSHVIPEAERQQREEAHASKEAQRRELRLQAMDLRREARELDPQIEELRRERQQYEPVPAFSNGVPQRSSSGDERPRADLELVQLQHRRLDLSRQAAELDVRAERL